MATVLAQQSRHVAERRKFHPPLAQRHDGLTLEIHDEKVAARVGQDWKSDAARKKITEYNERVGRAATEINDITAESRSRAAATGAQ